MKWTLEYIEKLYSEGRIRGYKVISKPVVKHDTPKGQIISKLFKKKSKAKEWIETQLFYWCQDRCLILKSEFKFHDTRKWKFDYCIESLKIAIEFEGGVFDRNGSHTSVKDIQRDIEKYNAAACLGWKVLRFTAINYKNLLTELNNAV